ncbi:MAG: AfsR/SARP family transcriptional regulator, partial [Acidimicrobiales bacterium]
MRFSLLGPLRVEHEDNRIDVGGGKLHVVLTALILARTKVVSTDRLVELIWAGDPPAKPYVTARSYISNLRRILEPDRGAGDRRTLLVTRSPGYALDVPADAVDAFLFERDLANGTALFDQHRFDESLVAIDDGLGRWNSDDLTDSPLSTFGSEADRLLELRRQAVGLRFDALLETGRHLDAIPDLRSLVDADATGERHRAQLMLGLYRAGRPADAIDVHQAGVRATIDATGLDASPALAELERRILNNDPALDWMPKQAVTSAPVPTR